MKFNSIEFLLFFPIVTIIYYILVHKFRWAWLLVASCAFYMVAQPIYILIIIATIVIDYFAAILIDQSVGSKRRNYLILSLVANLGILILFKYNLLIYDTFKLNMLRLGYKLNFSTFAWAVPLGLSFHTFQAMAYTIEVYRGHQKPERHFGLYALYVLFYPQMVAGPIERPQNILHQFRVKQSFNYQNFVDGLRLIGWGLIKKVVIADRLAQFIGYPTSNPEEFEGISYIVSSIFFSIQIYCDFSGYSDIALGCALVMGFRLMENFRFPYFATSVSAFWSRWHISLSTWFRDYVYIPLGGNRTGSLKKYRNVLIVFALSGIWHGSNWHFAYWGILHAIFLISEQLIDPLWKPFIAKVKNEGLLNLINFLLKIKVFLLVSFAWIFFRTNRLVSLKHILNNLFSGLSDLPAKIQDPVYVNKYIYLFQSKEDFFKAVLFSILLIFVDSILVKKSLNDRFNHMSFYLRWAIYLISISFFVFQGEFSKPSTFIYFQF